MIKNLNGIIFSLIIAYISMYIANLFTALHINPFIIAIFLGVLIANTIKIPDSFKPGITFTSKKILRFAIILLGFKISINEIMNLGLNSLLVITLSVISCYIFTVWIGQKIGVDKKLSTLLASGTSICGASAIIATNEVIKADDKDAAISVGIISIVGTFFMILLPIIFYALKLNQNMYSVWVGSSIQEVAQVVGAGFSVNDETGKLSSLIKMSRVTFIVPMTFYLLFTEMKTIKKETSTKKLDLKSLNIPWFVLMFIVVIFINSLNIIPKEIVKTIIYIDNLLLTASMFCLGLGISISKLKEAGRKPIYLGFISAIQISLTAFIASYFLIS